MNGQRERQDGFGSVLALAHQHLGCDHSGVAVRGPEGAVFTLAASDELVGVADRLQAAHADGPAVTPAWSAPQLALDLTEAGPWPVWTRGLAGLGVVSVLATQIVTTEGETGALTLYYSHLVSFPPHMLALASVLARYAGSELHHARQSDHLRVAVEGRTRIGQAQGILMDQYGLGADEAFAVLRRHSQDTNTKLRDVAAAVVESGELGSYAIGGRA